MKKRTFKFDNIALSGIVISAITVIIGLITSLKLTFPSQGVGLTATNVFFVITLVMVGIVLFILTALYVAARNFGYVAWVVYRMMKMRDRK